jgi:hypothetical protein
VGATLSKFSIYKVPGGRQLVEIGDKTTKCVFTGSRKECEAEMKKLKEKTNDPRK